MGRGERGKREDHRGGHCDRPGSNAAGEGERGPVPHVPGRWSPEVCRRPGWQRRRTRKGSGLFRQNQGRLREEGARGKDWHTQREMSRGRAQMSRAQGRACLQMGLLRHLLKPEVLRATRGPHVCAVKPALYFLI